MKHAMKKATALLLTLCALFSMAVPGIATEPVITVESEPIVEAIETDAPAEPATLTLAVGATLLKEINALANPQGQLGSVRIVEELADAPEANWSLSRTKGEALTLSLAKPTGKEVTLAYAVDSAFAASSEQVSYTLTCSVGELTQTMQINVTVVRKPTAILPAQASVTANAGEAFSIDAPKPQPEGVGFPEGTAFSVRIDGADSALAGLMIEKEGVYAATVVAAFGGTKLEAPITITVQAVEQPEAVTPTTQTTPTEAETDEGDVTEPITDDVTPEEDGTELPSEEEGDGEGTTDASPEPEPEETGAEVTKIVITPQKSELTEGESTLVFGMVFSDGEVDKEEETLEWTSSDPDILSIERIEDGGSEERARVTAGEPGEVTLTATAPNGVSAQMTMEVMGAAGTYSTFMIISGDTRFVGGIAKIDLATSGATLQLATDGDGGLPVTWKSSSTTVSVGAKTGLVTVRKATGIGGVTITATCNGQEATCTVIAGYKMPELGTMEFIRTAGPDREFLYTGESWTLALSPKPHANVKTTVSVENNPGITVTKSGQNFLVKAATSPGFENTRTGVVNVTVTDDFGGTETLSYNVSVIARITSVVIQNVATSKPITTHALNTTTNTTVDLKVVTTPGNKADEYITWSTTNEAIALISNSDGELCTVTAGTPGTATITAKATDGSNKQATVRVTVTAGVEDVIINKPTSGFANDLMSGTSMRLTATVLPATTPNKTVTWKFSDASGEPLNTSSAYATISNGTVTAKAGIPLDTEVHVVAISADGTVVSDPYDIVLHPALPTFSILVDGVVQKTAVIGLDPSDPNPILETSSIPEDAILSGPSWSSSNPSIVSVNGWGELTAYKAGTVTITAEITGWNNVKRTATVSVTCKSLVQEIEIVGPDPLFVAAGKTVSLGAKLTPSTATTRTVKWSSDDPAVAKVSTSGVVTGANVAVERSTTIRVETTDGKPGVFDTRTITVYPATTAVEIYRLDDSSETKITTASIDLYNGNSNQLKLGFRITPVGAMGSLDGSDAWKKVTWTSSNTRVATVDEFGVVTALSQGSAMITATAADGTGKKASVTVTVAHLVGSVVITGPNDVGVGRNIQLTANILPDTATNKGVTWTSSNTARATVTAAGSVRGVSSTSNTGPVIITATAKDGSGKFDVHEINVMSSAKTILIKVDEGGFLEHKPELSIDLGSGSQEIQLSCEVSPPDASQIVTYTSSNAGIASVDTDSGLIKGHKAGTVTITATAADGSGVRQTIKVTVSVAITDMTIVPIPRVADDLNKLQPPLIQVAAGKTMQLDVVFEPANATHKTFTWTSSNTSVATVSSTGLVTARSVSNKQPVEIIAVAKDGSGAFAKRTIQVLPAATSVSILEGSTVLTSKNIDVNEIDMQLSANVMPISASQAVTWKSSNTVVATVDDEGLVKFTGRVGEVKITATTRDGSAKSASVTLKVLQFVTGPDDYAIDGPKMLGAGKSAQLRIVRTVNDVMYENKVATEWSIEQSGDGYRYATIDKNGKITISAALKTKELVTVIAKALDGSNVVAEFDIEIAPSTTSLAIWQLVEGVRQSTVTTMGIAIDATVMVEAAILPVGAIEDVVWTTSNAAIAGVTTTGASTATIKGLKKGQAIITVTAQDGSGKRATVTVNVDEKTTKLEIGEGTALNLVAGKTKQLTLIATPSNLVTRDVIWESDAPTVAKVSATGLVTAVGQGSATISVKAKDGTNKGDSIAIEVYEKAVTSMFISLDGETMITETWVTAQDAGQKQPTRSLKPVFTPVGEVCEEVTWTSSNTNIVEVNKNGKITGIKNGKAIITATALDGSGKKATVTVTVQTIIEEIILNGNDTGEIETIELKPGKSKTIKATFNPAKPTNTTLTWSSNNTDVATVNAAGTVVVKSTAPSGKTATITATATDGSGKSAKIKIKVP